MRNTKIKQYKIIHYFSSNELLISCSTRSLVRVCRGLKIRSYGRAFL